MPLPHHSSSTSGDAPEISQVGDRAWIASLRAGDARAFEMVFREYHAALASFAYRYVQSPDIAEELVQEIFLDVWVRRASIDFGAAVKTYLFTAVRNAALSYLRHQRVEHHREGEVVALFSTPRPSADADLQRAELAAAVHRAIARLPERSRVIFTLRREQGMSYAEIAGILGISVKTVENQIGRALKALRKSLSSYWP